jgi:hypothetical protein
LASQKTVVRANEATNSNSKNPSVDSERGFAKVDRTGQDLDCQNIPPTLGPVPAAVLERCGTRTRTVDIPTSLVPEVQRGPIIVEDATSATVNTSSVPTISTLVSFAALTPAPGTDFPADVEILTTDLQNVYQITSSGAVSRYDSNGVQTAVSAIAPPAGQTWSELAVDPTTGIVYGAAVTCGTTSTLHTMNLPLGTRVQLGTITGSTCLIGMAFNNLGQLFGYDIVNDSLISINKVTGAGAVVGPLGFDANFGQGMDCDPSSGTCYLFAFNNTAFRAELRSVNTGTGATTLVSQIGNTAPGGTVQVPGAVFGTIGTGTCTNVGSARTETCATAPGDASRTCASGDATCLPRRGCSARSTRCDPQTGGRFFTPNPARTPTPAPGQLQRRKRHLRPRVLTPAGSAARAWLDSGAGTGLSGRGRRRHSVNSAALCSVEINGYSHTFPDDVDVLLSGPTGGTPNAIIMSDVGGSTAIANVNLTLTDTAANSLPDAGPLVSGTFKPTNIGTGDVFPAPAPVASSNTTLAVFSGLNPNGNWSFWINDQFSRTGARSIDSA